jgi:serine/threonine protein kinase
MLPQRYHLSMQLASGRVVGGWEVEAELGRGAMAVVYRVRHTALGTRAALKVLDRVDETTERRLLEEGRAQGSVQHESVVAVLDHLHIDGHAALLLEHVEGGDLARLLKQGPLPLPEALELFRQLVGAVAAAHDAGLVHRDLKPGNVLIADRPDGSRLAKVGDFGLVKTAHGELTATHALMGTPRYMAPEQMRAAREVDPRADLFALGCILYELCCGRPPFVGDDLVQLYAAKMGGHYAAPAQLVPDLPAPVQAALAGCLKGSPSQRIPSCRVLLAVLDGLPWSGGSEETMEREDGLVLCPACDAPADGELCAACGACSTLAGRYRLVERLRRPKGRNRLWKALDLREGGWVLVRALDRAASSVARARFERGARVQRELEHPQIAQGIDGPFEESGQLFEVRQWISGRSLADDLPARRYSEPEVLQIVVELCEPLRYLASRSPAVVHRAVAPEHVLRAEDGRLVLVDLAQVRDTPGDGSLHDVPSAAPEQWVGEASPATDVHGLGTLAVTLLARKPAHTLLQGGRIAWEGQTQVSPGTTLLLQAMLDPEPARRPSIEEVARRARTLGLAPSQLAQAPRRRLAGRMIAGGVGSAMAAAALLGCGGLMFVVALVSLLEDGTSEPGIEIPEGPSPRRRLEPGPDLATRDVPGASCGPTFRASIVLRSDALLGERVPLFARACDGTLHALGELEVGKTHTLELPGPSELMTPYHGAQCGTRSFLARTCSVKAAEDEPIPVSLVLTADEQPLLEEGVAVKGASLWPARSDDWARRSDGGPLLESPRALSQQPWYPGVPPLLAGPDGALPRTPLISGEAALQIDGVFRRPTVQFVGPGQPELHLPPPHEPVGLRVVDPAGEPIADAEIQCTSQGQADVSARTDTQGLAYCDPGPGESRWAVVQAPGRVAEVTQLVPPVVQVTLREARTLKVGCAGLPDDRCATMETPPVCAGGTERSMGICRFSGGALTCECSPDATAVVHGILGTAPIPSGRDQVWFDLRSIPGRLEGEVRGVDRSCTLELWTRRGALQIQTDRQGRYSLPFVPEGRYSLDGRCGPVQIVRRLVRVGRETAEANIQTRSWPEEPEREAPSEDSVERKLLYYEFPAWPSPEIVGEWASCTARVQIDEQGRATDAVIHGCSDAFVSAARDSVMRWQWAPAERATTEELQIPFDADRTETEVF